MNIREATEHWVRGFNAIPQSFITSALGDRLFDEFVEVTPDLYYCKECGCDFTEYEKDGIIEVAEQSDGEVVCIHCKNETEIMDYQEYHSEITYQDYLPMWGTMWTLEDGSDERWVEENIDTMYKLGFRVYEHEDLGIVIGIDGIDGAVYDFYKDHWIPLYKVRGLRWHNENAM